MPFEFRRLEIPDVVLAEPRVFEDERGFFMETYKRSDFQSFGIGDLVVQDNYSHSARGTLRGLHYQKNPKAQAKLVQVIQGEILDVAVDIRSGSPTYGRWVSAVLSSENHRMLFVPIGFAHGFLVLSDQADVVYKVSGGEYAPDLERGILWNDTEIGIQWTMDNPLLSEKDAILPPLSEADHDFAYAGVIR